MRLWQVVAAAAMLSGPATSLRAAAQSPSDRAAPKKVEIFDVLDQTASAKLTAWWGTDYLLLAKYDGRWMVREVLWQTPPRR